MIKQKNQALYKIDEDKLIEQDSFENLYYDFEN